MQRKKSILLLTSSYPSDSNDGRAAAGFFVRDFAEELSAQSDLSVITQYTGEGPLKIEQKKYAVIRFSWLGKGPPLSTLSLTTDIVPILSLLVAGIFASVRHVRRKKTDHIIALWAVPCGIWALILKKIYNIPYSIWCLGADIWNYQNSRLTRALLRLVLIHADHVYADGVELSNMVNDIAAVDCTFLASSRHFNPPLNQYSLKPAGVRHYLFVGRYHHNKGPDIMIKAIQLLPPEVRAQIHCHLFGGGPLTAELELMVGNSGLEETVTLGGFIGEEKLTEILCATDVIAIPSRIDSVSLMLSAALQLNKAIIATDVGDTGYLLKKYKVGSVVPANSPESIAKCIQNDLASPNDSESGRSSILEILDISNSSSRIIKDIEGSKPNC